MCGLCYEKKAVDLWIWKAQKYPLQPGADATAAILYAAMGNAGKAEAYIERLKSKQPDLAEQIQVMTRQILRGTHPAFPR